jgi:hypothetical protein
MQLSQIKRTCLGARAMAHRSWLSTYLEKREESKNQNGIHNLHLVGFDRDAAKNSVHLRRSQYKTRSLHVKERPEEWHWKVHDNDWVDIFELCKSFQREFFLVSVIQEVFFVLSISI